MAEASMMAPSNTPGGQAVQPLFAHKNADFTTPQTKNIYCGTGGMTNNSTNLENNVIYLQYE